MQLVLSTSLLERVRHALAYWSGGKTWMLAMEEGEQGCHRACVTQPMSATSCCLFSRPLSHRHVHVHREAAGGVVAGCRVSSGALKADLTFRVLRDGIVVHEGRAESIKRAKLAACH